jgi:Thermostable hemolysin
LVLKKFFDRPVSRDVIVELGSFASTGFTMSAYLLGAVSAYLAARGVEVALATATNKLNRLFAIFDLHTEVICLAGRAALQDQQADWGSYYAADPRVVVGSTRQCLAAVIKSLATQNTPKRSAALASLIAQAQVHG